MNINVAEIIEQQGSPIGRKKRRFHVLSTALCITMLAIVARGAFLQVFQGSTFRARAEHNRLDNTIVPAPRGIIYDMHHTQLVENISSTDLIITPTDLPLREDETYMIDRLSAILTNVPPEEIQTAITKARTTKQNTLLS